MTVDTAGQGDAAGSGTPDPRAGTRAGTGPSGPARLRTLVFLLGPAFVAAVAYVDPGNVAANVTAGARFGFLLVWVLVLSNAMAVLVQYLSATLGLVTGRSLPELVGSRLHTGPRRAYWIQAELVAIATDLAEVVGGAVALRLLFGLPLPVGGLIVGLVSMGVLAVQSRRGQRRFESIVLGLLVIITVGFTAGLFTAPVPWGQVAGGLVPRFAGGETVLLAASMLGATVMPHTIYLHSALARDRHRAHDRTADRVSGSSDPDDPGRIARLVRVTRWDVVGALAIAGAVNVAMLLLAGAALHDGPGRATGVASTDTIEGAHAALEHALGPGIGAVFAIGLLASGLASTSVGSYAGAVIMAGLSRIRVSLVVRRAITIVPALAILALGLEPTQALVVSQAVLGLGIPFALVPLVRYAGDRALMGAHAMRAPTRVLAWTVVVLTGTLDLTLVALTVAGST